MRNEDRILPRIGRAALSISLLISSVSPQVWAVTDRAADLAASRRSSSGRLSGSDRVDLGIDGAPIDVSVDASPIETGMDLRLRPEASLRQAVVLASANGAALSPEPNRNSISALRSLGGSIEQQARTGGASAVSGMRAASGLTFENSVLRADSQNAESPDGGGAMPPSGGGANGGNGDDGSSKKLERAPDFTTMGDLVSLLPGDKVRWQFTAGGEHSAAIMQHVERQIVVVPQGLVGRDSYIGTRAILRSIVPPSQWKTGAEYVMEIEGIDLVEIHGTGDFSDLHYAHFEPLNVVRGDEKANEALIANIKEDLMEIASNPALAPGQSQVMQNAWAEIEEVYDPVAVSLLAIKHLPFESARKQQDVLGAPSIEVRLQLLAEKLAEMRVELESKVGLQQDVRKAMLTKQREAIDKELGEDAQSELAELKAKIDAVKPKMSKVAADKVAKEFKRLSSMNPMSAEATVSRTWLERALALPWGKSDVLKTDLAEGRRMLDEDHYGMEKIKRRIMERVAVLQHTGNPEGKIFLIVGPKGVGKTSLGQSIARATGRSYQRVALGGVEDEAEIRGHRSTYIGAQPGRIMEAVERLGSNNGMVMLDEVDKLGARPTGGRPHDALLEVLDPKQNHTFTDHYYGIPFDLSKILFIATANSLAGIPAPLLDRMEIIHLEGYDEDEKVEIAKRHIIPQQLAKHKVDVKFPDETIRHIVTSYTREPGVRKLEDRIIQILDHYVFLLQMGEQMPESLSPAEIDKNYLEDPITREKAIQNGLAVGTGLWVSEDGGSGTLPAEVVLIPRPAGAVGDGEIKLSATGLLREVMEQSAKVALAAVTHLHKTLGIKIEDIQKYSYHLHLPDGATPKDGPSAGLLFATVFTSALTGRPVKKGVAMTGEISAHGQALPIGGLPGKTLAAQRDGMSLVIYPAGNEKDKKKITAKAQEGLTMTPVTSFLDVVKLALEPAAEPPKAP